VGFRAGVAVFFGVIRQHAAKLPAPPVWSHYDRDKPVSFFACRALVKVTRAPLFISESSPLPAVKARPRLEGTQVCFVCSPCECCLLCAARSHARGAISTSILTPAIMHTETEEYAPVTSGYIANPPPGRSPHAHAVGDLFSIRAPQLAGATFHLRVSWLIPALWHRYSVCRRPRYHVYNAWPRSLTERGHAPGLGSQTMGHVSLRHDL